MVHSSWAGKYPRQIGRPNLFPAPRPPRAGPFFSVDPTPALSPPRRFTLGGLQAHFKPKRRTRRWCQSNLCGNRQKTRTYRERLKQE
ncbi:CGNR zinc finger domain-containing protein [Bradyrhizobium sp.]|uniref:CGNR zinc finger domain-containing protein n=1 Tax=Bradyrhizobium sp. TaxID=376 RepID=UPI003C6EDB45